MNDDIRIFDRALLRANRNRAARKAGHDFLHEWAARNLCTRLEDIRREFPVALCLGAHGAETLSQSNKIGALMTMDIAEKRLAGVSGPRIHGDEELLPFSSGSLDLVLSPLVLHAVNDLPGALVQIRQALKPDGLFLAAMLGGETLYELRQVMAEAEISLRGGISPRIAPFADKPQAGELLQRAGFSLPVVDSEIVTVTYENIFRLMNDLRHMGEGNAIIRRDRRYAGKALFMEAARLYQDRFGETDGRIRATFEIIFMIGWHPHESQQKPAKRGSATHSLADFLQ
ncbi:MAG: methyltransferase domain-containing protein [Micavibrio aeruginosavorus]|nr:methyltransferase domain-containing protein [Micavibrio aeruginosavorus]